MKMNSRRGFTLIELMIVVAAVGTVVVLLMTAFLFKANYWFSEASVTAQLQKERPDVTEVVKITRNIMAFSRIEVPGGVICLDTDVLFNYEFVACEYEE